MADEGKLKLLAPNEVPEAAARIKSATIDPTGWDEDQSGRMRGLGGSDIAAVLGIHPYKTAFDVWYGKTHGIAKAAPALEDTNEFVRWGVALEPVILSEYARRTKRRVELWSKVMLRHNSIPVLQVSPDGVCLDEDRLAEVKNVGVAQAHRWGEPGTDDAPLEYVIQCSHAMAVTEFPVCDLVPLIGGNDYRCYPIRRDLELEAMIIETATEFWTKHVLTGVPPAPVGKSATVYLRKRFPNATAELRPALPPESDLMELYLAIVEREKQVSEIKELVGNRLRLQIGEAEGIAGPDFRATWRKTKPTLVTEWERLARSLGATEEQIAAATFEQDGYRKLHVSKATLRLKGRKR